MLSDSGLQYGVNSVVKVTFKPEAYKVRQTW
jgi:hypothetical protein